MTTVQKRRPQVTPERPLDIPSTRSVRRALTSSSTGESLLRKMSKPSVSPSLQECLAELEDALETAAREGGLEPVEAIVQEARRFLEAICREVPRTYMAYLMPDGTIAIDTRGPRPDGVLITFNLDGTAYCSGEIDGKHWNKKYCSTANLPDHTLVDELEKLGSTKNDLAR